MDDLNGVDVTVPNVARMYDYALGGRDNFAVDREAAQAIARANPGAFQVAHDNRAFLKRSVSYVAAQGVTQFIDIGSGLPTAENTHQVARAVNPASRVAYVDSDPVVVAHAAALLADGSACVALLGDLREPASLLADPALGKLIDLGQPFAVVAIAVLHFLADPVAGQAVSVLTQAMPRGSYLIVSHATADAITGDGVAKVNSEYRKAAAPLSLRSRPAVAAFFDGLDLVDPGVTDINAWRAAPRSAAGPACYGGVARKP